MNAHTRFLSLAALALAPALLLTACPSDDGDDGDPYVFAEDEPSSYARIDRIGMPAVASATISSKEAYNQADPTNDAAGEFVDEITANVQGLHDALDDDLSAAGLTPCATADCVAQAAPHVVPDTIKLDLTGESGFPNGRRLTDRVIDVTLALVLLDLTVDGQTVESFFGVLNPAGNDLEFGSTFPYLADPHSI